MRLRSIDFDGRVECFHWTSLKVLTLKSIRLENDMIRSILLGSPLMEYLELSWCKFNVSVGIICIIDTSDTNLKTLVIDSCSHDSQQINISGANLLSLTIEGHMVPWLISHRWWKLRFILSQTVQIYLGCSSVSLEG